MVVIVFQTFRRIEEIGHGEAEIRKHVSSQNRFLTFTRADRADGLCAILASAEEPKIFDFNFLFSNRNFRALGDGHNKVLKTFY